MAKATTSSRRLPVTIPDLAMGVTVFMRTERLEQLLISADEGPFERVYVADNGVVDDRESLYSRNWSFDLTVLDLPYDSGLGYARREIVDAMEESYLLIVDSDMRIPSNVGSLFEQLKCAPNYGGISGILLEGNRIRSGCWNLYERGVGRRPDVIVLDLPEQVHLETVAGSPLATFDQIPNAAIFRRDCLEEYCWDPTLQIEEHLDFYIGHMKTTDWSFGVNPRVVFPHDFGGDEPYLAVRRDNSRVVENRRRSLRKWGYRKRLYAQDRGWLDTQRPSSVFGHFRDFVMEASSPRARILLDDIIRGRHM